MGDDDEFSETDVPKNFSVISWFMTIPLCDDVWLGMQAQHIAAGRISAMRQSRKSVYLIRSPRRRERGTKMGL
jgi:hypothetical protein